MQSDKTQLLRARVPRRQSLGGETELKKRREKKKDVRKKEEKRVGVCDQIQHVVLTFKLSFLNRYSAGVSTPTIPPFFRHRLDKIEG
jgi:hypothetical protein